MEVHTDVPEFIRELVYAKEEQKLERKQKRKASGQPEGNPLIKIINVLPSSYEYRHGSPAGTTGTDAELSSVASTGCAADLVSWSQEIRPSKLIVNDIAAVLLVPGSGCGFLCEERRFTKDC